MGENPMIKSVLGACIALGCVALTAKADVLTWNASVPLTDTDWVQNVSIPKFDPSLGTLTSIDFSMTAHIEGSSFYENQETSPTMVSLTLAAEMSLLRPDMSSLITVNPSTTVGELAGAFDGMIDFGGTSGNTFNNLFADITQSASSPPPASDLALFTGLGNILLPVSAMGDSSGAGPGNWIFGFALAASADVTVKYNYTPVPEPTSAATLVLAGLGLLLRRRV